MKRIFLALAAGAILSGVSALASSENRGAAQAAAAIDGGGARAVLDRLVEISGRGAPAEAQGAAGR